MPDTIVNWNDESLHVKFIQRIFANETKILAIQLLLAEQSDDYKPGTLFEVITLREGEKAGTVLVKNYSECEGAFDALCTANILAPIEEEQEGKSVDEEEEESEKKNTTFECQGKIIANLPSVFRVWFCVVWDIIVVLCCCVCGVLLWK